MKIRKIIFTLFVYILFSMSTNPATLLAFHNNPFNPDPEQRAEHVVGKGCKSQHSYNFQIDKLACGDDVMAFTQVDPKRNKMYLIALFHHHDDGTAGHGWIDKYWAITGRTSGEFMVVDRQKMSDMVKAGMNVLADRYTKSQERETPQPAMGERKSEVIL